MRSVRPALSAAVIAGGACLAMAQSGGVFEIKDATVVGSSHVSSGGPFVSEVRLGEGLAGPMLMGGSYTVGGGFFPPPPPPPILTPPSAPADLEAVALSAGEVGLSWTDTSDNEEGFVVQRCTVAGKRCKETLVIASLGPNVSTFHDASVSKNTTYEYQISAVNAAGVSDPSNVVRVKTLKR